MSFIIIKIIIVLLIIYVSSFVFATHEHKKQDMQRYRQKYDEFFCHFGEVYTILAPYNYSFNKIFVDYLYKNSWEQYSYSKIDSYCRENNINKTYFNSSDKLFESSIYQMVKLCMPQYLSIFSEPITFLEDDAKNIAKRFLQCTYIEVPKNKIVKCNIDSSKFIYDYIADYSEGMFAVKKDNKWGFIDENSNVIIPLIYDAVSSFHNQKAIVKILDKLAFINPDGSTSLEFTDYEIKYALLDYLLTIEDYYFKGLCNFSFEECKSLIENEESYNLNIYDEISNTFLNRENYNKYKDYKNVKKQMEQDFEEYRKERNKEAEKLRTYRLEKTKDGVNIIDKDGYPLLPRYNEYCGVDYFNNDFFIIKKKESFYSSFVYCGLVNKKGKMILSCDYKYINEGDKYIIIEKYSGQGLFDISSEQIILPCNYENISGMHRDEELFIVKNNESKYSIFSAKKKKFITDFIFDEIGYFENWASDLPVPVKIGGKIGFVNRKGEFVTDCIYDHPYLEIAIKNGTWFLSHYLYGEEHPYIDENYIIVYQSGKYGYINHRGTELISCVFDDANKFVNGFAVVQYGNKYGIINENMEVI
ncbi:WG repeat-containing protein [bacterium]|nr:WG repeat-containing protein [bacterium]